MLPAYLLLVRAGFRRHSTYFAATLGGLFTNTVFGLLRVAVLLAVAAEAGRAAGYDAATSSTFVWLGLIYATPFPALLQTPIDVFTERGPVALLLGHQLLWAVALLAVTRLVLARATRKLVVQGG